MVAQLTKADLRERLSTTTAERTRLQAEKGQLQEDKRRLLLILAYCFAEGYIPEPLYLLPAYLSSEEIKTIMERAEGYRRFMAVESQFSRQVINALHRAGVQDIVTLAELIASGDISEICGVTGIVRCKELIQRAEAVTLS